MLLTRKQFLGIAGPGALGAAAHSALGLPGRAEAREIDEGAAAPGPAPSLSFQASAAAFGGQIDLPFPDVLDVQAATVLPPSGGRGSAQIENYRYGQVENNRSAHVVSIGAARSEVFGGRREIDRAGRKVTVFETLATVTMTDVKIGEKERAKSNFITVAKIVGSLTSFRTSDPQDTPLRHAESKIEGLEINGQKVDLDLHEELKECETVGAVADKTYSGFRHPVLDENGKPLRLPVPEGSRKSGAWPDFRVRTSIFQEPPAVKAPLVHVPGLCRIRVGQWILTLGELEITPQHRRLTMLRVVMKPNQAGELVFAYVEGNGREP